MEQKKKKKVSRAEAEKQERILKRRRGGILLVMAETVVCLILAIVCFGVNVLGSYAYEELDKEVYKATTTANASAQKATTVVEVTNEEGSVVETSVQEVTVDEELQTGYRNILIVGVDARSQDSLDDGVNTDVMIIVSINNATNEIKMCSILRDTIMKMETGSTEYNKVNHQFAVSGIGDTLSMLNRNLDLDIDEYVVVNWAGVAQCVSILGGVELTIPNERILGYFNGYLTETNEKTGLWTPQIEEPGTYVLTGTQVVAYCRIRYGGWEDEGRASNQREVITKLLGRVKDLISHNDYGTVLECVNTGLSNVRTNLKMPDVISLSMNAMSYNVVDTTYIPQKYEAGTYVGNYFDKYHVVDPMVALDYASEVTALHQFLFDDYDYQPSQFIQDISYQMYLDRTGQ